MDTLLKQTIDLIASTQCPEMTSEGKAQLEALLTRREAEKGEIMLKEGETSRHIVLVGKGMLRQFYYKNGKDLTEHFSYEGSVVICIESTLKREPTRLMVEALEPSIVYMLPYDRLLQATETSRELDIFYRRILEYSLIVSQVKADSWRFETASERYRHLLKSHPEIIKRAPMSHIASYLLMTPETLSRVRASLQ